jgi:GWxTD domain-containing protein
MAAGTTIAYDRWLNGDVVYLIDDRERAAFRSLQTDAERERFNEQFWLRRDPTPGITENEVKEEPYRRIAYAVWQFGVGRPTAAGSISGSVRPTSVICFPRTTEPPFPL